MYRSFHFSFLFLMKKHKVACLCKVIKAQFTKEKKTNIAGCNNEYKHVLQYDKDVIFGLFTVQHVSHTAPANPSLCRKSHKIFIAKH